VIFIGAPAFPALIRFLAERYVPLSLARGLFVEHDLYQEFEVCAKLIGPKRLKGAKNVAADQVESVASSPDAKPGVLMQSSVAGNSTRCGYPPRRQACLDRANDVAVRQDRPAEQRGRSGRHSAEVAARESAMPEQGRHVAGQVQVNHEPFESDPGIVRLASPLDNDLGEIETDGNLERLLQKDLIDQVGPAPTWKYLGVTGAELGLGLAADSQRQAEWPPGGAATWQ
jgi:hypothetical protein